MFVWQHGLEESSSTHAATFYEEPIRQWILGEVVDHDGRITAMGGKPFGVLWIPDPSTGRVEGAGWIDLLQHTGDIDNFLTAVTQVPRESGVKITRNVLSPMFEMPAGPAALHEITQKRRKPAGVQHTRRLWVFPEGTDVLSATLIYEDGSDGDAAIDALAELVLGIKVDPETQP